MKKAEAEVARSRGTTPPGGINFKSFPRRKRNGQLRAEDRSRLCRPQTARAPHGGCRYAIVLRAAAKDAGEDPAKQPGRVHTTTPKSLRGRSPNWQTLCYCPASKQRAFLGRGGEEWWGWIIGQNDSWQPRGSPRPLQPPTTHGHRPRSCPTAHVQSSAPQKGRHRIPSTCLVTEFSIGLQALAGRRLDRPLLSPPSYLASSFLSPDTGQHKTLRKDPGAQLIEDCACSGPGMSDMFMHHAFIFSTCGDVGYKPRQGRIKRPERR